MSEIVIANAGPLMALAKLNLLHLLKQLYGQVQFPRSVYEEASSHLDRGERESIAFLSAPRLNVNSEDYLTYIAFQVKRKPHSRLTGY